MVDRFYAGEPASAGKLNGLVDALNNPRQLNHRQLEQSLASVLAARTPDLFIPVIITAVNTPMSSPAGAPDGAYTPADVTYDYVGHSRPGIVGEAVTPTYGRPGTGLLDWIIPAQVDTLAHIIRLPGTDPEQPGVITETPLVLLPGAEQLVANAGWFVAKITSSSTDGTNRWKYSWLEQSKASAGHAGWANLIGGRSGDSLRMYGESGNTSTVAGSVDTSGMDYPAGFAPVPLPNGTIVRVDAIVLDDGETVEYWGTTHNTAHDGSCEA